MYICVSSILKIQRDTLFSQACGLRRAIIAIYHIYIYIGVFFLFLTSMPPLRASSLTDLIALEFDDV